MSDLNEVFSKIKNYCNSAPSHGFVCYESICKEAKITRAELKTHLASLKKMKLINYSATGTCYLSVTKLGSESKSIPLN
jgi:RIO-like serine/threonine protein kinase